MTNEQIKAVRTLLAENPVVTPGASLDQMRSGLDAMGKAAKPLANVKTEQVDANGVEAYWVSAATADPDSTVVLYFHGGGYVMGSALSHRALTERLAAALKGRVLVVNYRLAPEHPFPAATDDALVSYQWLLAQGIAPNKIAIAGDSAGGGLTIAALVAIREAGEPLPACATAISPWVDMEALGESMVTKAAVDPMVQKAALAMIAPLYLNGTDPRTPLAAPLYANLNGLPPILIQVGSAETLLDDSTRLSDAIEQAGGAVTLEVWDDMIHVWHLFAPMLDKGQEAIERIAEFSTEHCQGA
ncbi:MAG: alpha/beta hydrolase [Gammaproteobacteria bacterium]